MIGPPDLPPRPAMLDTVEWVGNVSPEDAKLAYKFWFLPDSEIRQEIEKIGHFFLDESPEHDLARNVYERLGDPNESLLPVAGGPPDSLEQKTWPYSEVFGSDKEIAFKDTQNSTINQLRKELAKRELSTRGKKIDLLRRLHGEGKHQVLPRSDLSRWGITRSNHATKFAVSLTPDNSLSALDMYTSAIKLSPYNPAYWLGRAHCHFRMMLFDLAIGDAYRAELLCEVLTNPIEKHRIRGLEGRIRHAIEQHINAIGEDKWGGSVTQLNPMGQDSVTKLIPTLQKTVHNIISLSLLALQCWDDFDVMEKHTIQKFQMSRRDSHSRKASQPAIYQQLFSADRQGKDGDDILFHLKRSGSCPGGKEYPYEPKDTDRYLKSFVARLNQHISTSIPCNKCEVGVLQLPGNHETLGMFAAQDTLKDELVFVEDPSVRGHLNINRIRPDQVVIEAEKVRCDRCRRKLTRGTLNQYKDKLIDILQKPDPETCECLVMRIPLFFCPQDESQDKTCAQIARETYHFRACGKDWKWLHNAMRPGVSVSDSKLHFSYTNEVHGTLLSLLLREVFDITLLRRERKNDPNLMAHELDELLMLEGPVDWTSHHFPFTLAANIQVPFDILMQLGVDIFSDPSFDTWVIQIVLRKLLASVVLGDDHLRESAGTGQEKQLSDPQTEHPTNNTEDITSVRDPMFRILYLFPGLSMFNRVCWGAHNAEWEYDANIPNRMLIRATKDLRKGDEIRISDIRKDTISELFLRGCREQDCLCENHQPLGVKRKVFQTEATQVTPRKKTKSTVGKKAPGPGEMKSRITPTHSYNLRSRKLRHDG